jgi:hypothetical protein
VRPVLPLGAGFLGFFLIFFDFFDYFLADCDELRTVFVDFG